MTAWWRHGRIGLKSQNVRTDDTDDRKDWPTHLLDWISELNIQNLCQGRSRAYHLSNIYDQLISIPIRTSTFKFSCTVSGWSLKYWTPFLNGGNFSHIETEFFDVEEGVKQGCVLSPILFCIYINEYAKSHDIGVNIM